MISEQKIRTSQATDGEKNRSRDQRKNSPRQPIMDRRANPGMGRAIPTEIIEIDIPRGGEVRKHVRRVVQGSRHSDTMKNEGDERDWCNVMYIIEPLSVPPLPSLALKPGTI
jgi:hypothetical protein